MDPNSIDKDKLPDDIQTIEYYEIVDNIKKWIDEQKKPV